MTAHWAFPAWTPRGEQSRDAYWKSAPPDERGLLSPSPVLMQYFPQMQGCPSCLPSHVRTPLSPQRRVHMWTEGGRPTGMALVQFSTPQEASMARNKDKQLMGTR
jgi:hypothetical protein